MIAARDILAATLRHLARITIWRFRPGIIGITGSVGKTSAKYAIAAVLGGERDIRWARGNINNEIGLPLSVLGSWSPAELATVDLSGGQIKRSVKVKFWMKVLAKGVAGLFRRSASYPEILLLEYGAEKPGDIRYLLSIARPNVSIVTAVGDIPAHRAFYPSADDVAREKARLIECLPVAGFAVLNADDRRVLAMRDRTRGHVITYGFSDEADVRIGGFEHNVETGVPTGIGFRIEYGGSVVSLRIAGVAGRSHAYAAAAAAAVGLVFGMHPSAVAKALESYRPAEGRLRILQGPKGSIVLDDAYNASPMAMELALETLHDIPAKRRIAVLGDMLELGIETGPAHERIGTYAAKRTNLLVVVGSRAAGIAEAARRAGFLKRNIRAFADADEAAKALPAILRKGDVVLVKGSDGVHLDKVVEAVSH